MKKVLSVLIFLPLLMSFLTACKDSRPITDALHRAEALMNEHPDSAWAVLNALSPDEMGQNSTRAHYALLYTQAQEKNYIDETNDSLISVAVDYYRHTDDVRHKFLSYYYKGRVHFNTKDYLNATTCYMEAEQLADEVGDDYLVGLLYAELGRIYDIYYDYHKSLEAYQKAAECYGRAGKNRHRNYMWLNQSGIYRNLEQYEEGERLLRMTLAEGKADGDSVLIRNCIGYLIMLDIEQGRMMEAEGLLDELKSFNGDMFMSASFLGALSKLYISEGLFLEATMCVDEGWLRARNRTDSVSLYVCSAELYNRQGQGTKAYFKLLEGVVLQNKATRQVLQQPVLTVQRDYFLEKLEMEASLLQMEKRMKVISTLFFILLFGVSVSVFIRKFKKHKKKSEQAISNLKIAKRQAEAEKSKIAVAFQQLDRDKKNADETIAKLKEEIKKNEDRSNESISELKKKLEQEEQSNENLQKTLVDGKEIAHQTIQTLNDVVAEKEESRQKMEALIRQLESDVKLRSESVDFLRSELDALQNENNKMMFHKVELLKRYLEQIVEWVLLYDKKNLSEEKRMKRIEDGVNSLKKDYYADKGDFRKVESLVNQCLDNVMVHFRKEVSLPKESDYRRACYMFAGLSGQAIGEMMGESKDVVYQRKKRLLQKIAVSSCIHKNLFVVLLSK